MFKRNRIIRVLTPAFGLGLALGLSGCGSDGNRSEVRDPVEYIKQSCEYSRDEGEIYGTIRSATPVIEGYFGKPYNKDWLANVGHTSMRDTVAMIETTGATVYQANVISQKSCRNFGFTNTLPGDLAGEWRKADIRGPNNEFMSGLYLIKGTKHLDSLKHRSAVIVREDANRWTLVHEFMHHNFKSQAVIRGYDDDLLKRKVETISSQMETIMNDGDLPDRTRIRKVTPQFLELVEIIDQLSVQYFMEEIAVEATLQDKYDSGDLTFVPAGSYGNATWYVNHSKEKAVKMYASLEGLYTKLRERAIFSGANTEYHQLYRHKELKEKRLAQIDKMLKDREARKFRAGNFTDMQILSNESASSEGMAPCAQAITIEKQMDDLIHSITRIAL